MGFVIRIAVDELSMKKKSLKFILLFVLSSLISFETVAFTEESNRATHEIEEQQVIDVVTESHPVETLFAEDVSVDISNDELDDVLNKAFASN